MCDCNVDLNDIAKYVLDRLELDKDGIYKELCGEFDPTHISLRLKNVSKSLAAAKDEIITFKEER